ncbi:hypothetical protein [Nitrosomonas communis]|uniref:Uncharacterized protein n=1 Tax=Nitrosomonas communis TaxID=44574 RepID=A0A1H2VI66_9PROT|nr:hypothetical protein [Nitrosomonas communis]SDW68011.1 hypothetical protein SAMN05421882_10227 [Nitrosomonas communis]
MRYGIIHSAKLITLATSASAIANRNTTECRGNTLPIRMPPGIAPLVSQPEALVRCEQSVAAKILCTEIMKEDISGSMNTGSVIEPGCGRRFLYQCRDTVAQQAPPDRRPGSAVTQGFRFNSPSEACYVRTLVFFSVCVAVQAMQEGKVNG